jgi:glutamine amidotransferase
MIGLTDESEFYFVHSFHVRTNDSSIVLNETEYEATFVSAFEKENIYGVQFHPEKSHDSGKLLLQNFLKI